MRKSIAWLSIPILIAAAPVAGQQLDVTAMVPVASPAGAGTRNLLFGVLTPVAGTTQMVDIVASPLPVSGTVQSGEFRYNVGGVRGLDFTVTMPSQLTAPGADPLTVTSNGNQYGGYCVSAAAMCALTGFNPASGQNVRVCRVTFFIWCSPFSAFPGGTILRVYVGGLLLVPPDARGGVYTGTATLTIVQVL
ncbi:MAG: hypothetical protein WEF86_01050 [Gemmatimonadota bacterium]